MQGEILRKFWIAADPVTVQTGLFGKNAQIPPGLLWAIITKIKKTL